jgi:outer membrane protein, heavy metal efflux system
MDTRSWQSSVVLLSVVLTGAQASFAQQPGQEHHHPAVSAPAPTEAHQETHGGDIPEVMPEFPQLGHAQASAPQPRYRLADFEQLALAHNPTLVQVARVIEQAKGRRLQSGLYPNPTVGYSGTEVRGGSYNSGEQGLFVEQPVILGNKLGLNRMIGEEEVRRREFQADIQKYRVINSVRSAFYQVLSSQEMLGIDRDLLRISQDTVHIARQLHNVGQMDETEVLLAEVEEQRMAIVAENEEHRLRRRWLMLGNVTGLSELPAGIAEGSLTENLPSVDDESLLKSLLSESPEVKYARAGLAQAQAMLVRARREPVPDLVLRGGLQQDHEPLNTPGKPVGLIGYAEVGVKLRLWDRNKGGIEAATAEVSEAQEELQRVELALRDRSAAAAQQYRDSRAIVDRYEAEVLPRLRRAYELMTRQYGLMAASFSRVLYLQRTLFEAETDYIAALEQTWTTAIALRGFLLNGGLELTKGLTDSNSAESNAIPQQERPSLHLSK